MYVLQFFKRFDSFHIFCALQSKNVLAAQSIHQKVVKSTFKLHVACSVGTYLVFLKVFIHSLIILFIGLNEILSWIRNSCWKSSHRMVKNGNMKKQRSCQKSFGEDQDQDLGLKWHLFLHCDYYLSNTYFLIF